MPYRFGPFTLDPRTRRLLRDNQEVHLSPKAFELLQFLIENRSGGIPRANCTNSCGRRLTYCGTDLAGLVAEVRRALGDSADDPQFVRTMHRVGYWFMGRVFEGETDARPAAAEPTWGMLARLGGPRQVTLHRRRKRHRGRTGREHLDRRRQRITLPHAHRRHR